MNVKSLFDIGVVRLITSSIEPSKGMIAVAESKICAEVEKESSVIENKNVFMVFLLVQF